MRCDICGRFVSSGDKCPGCKTFQINRMVDEWNVMHPPGTEVILTDDLGNKMATRTRSVAWTLGSDSIIVKVDGRTGGYDVRRLEIANQTDI